MRDDRGSVLGFKFCGWLYLDISAYCFSAGDLRGSYVAGVLVKRVHRCELGRRLFAEA